MVVGVGVVAGVSVAEAEDVVVGLAVVGTSVVVDGVVDGVVLDVVEGLVAGSRVKTSFVESF